MEILRKNNEIVKMLFFINVLSFFLSFFWFKMSVFYIVSIFNIFLLGVNLIIKKYAVMFEGMMKVNKFAKNINKRLSGV
jgi:hypothetical protein